MEKEVKTEPAEVCPSCGKPMEPVYLSNDFAGMLVYHGESPAGLLGRLAQVFTGSLVRTESGEPVLFGFDPLCSPWTRLAVVAVFLGRLALGLWLDVVNPPG